MIYLLDTNAASAIADPRRATPNLDSLIQETDRTAMSVVTVAELEFGSVRVRDNLLRKSIERREAHLLTVVETIFAVTLEIAHRYALLKFELEKSGSQIPVNDLWIAATALVHECTLVSNDRHFDRVVGLIRIEL